MRRRARLVLLQAMGRAVTKDRRPPSRGQGMEPIPDTAGRAADQRVTPSAAPFEFDEIGDWSELKLEIIEKYGAAYTTAFVGRGRALKKYYIDGFSGAGMHLSRRTGQPVDGSPARALKVS